MNGNRTAEVVRQAKQGIHQSLYQSIWKVVLVAMFAAGTIVGTQVRLLQAATAPETLFQEALLKETGERDLEGALSIYQVVVQQAGDDRLLRAKTQLRIGICYERLGKVPEAIAAYEEVVMNAATTPTEIAQIAQTNLQRLHAQVAQEQKAQMALVQGTPARLTHRWGVSVEAGQTRLPHSTPRFVDHQNTLWGSVQYRVTSSLKVGLEGGYFFPQETREVPRVRVDVTFPEEVMTITTRNSAGYIGPFLQWGRGTGRLAWYLGGGAGAAIEETRRTTNFEGGGRTSPFEFSTVTLDVEPAVAFAGGLDVKVVKPVGIGVGLRDLLVVQRDRVAFEDRLRARHVLMPFARVSFTF